MRLAILLVTGLVLAGCAGPAPASGGTTVAGAPPEPSVERPAPSSDAAIPAPPRPQAAAVSALEWGFHAPVTALAACDDCFEPTIAVDGAGRIVVTAGDGDLAVSDDGGATFRSVPAPPLPDDAPDPAERRDVLVQRAPDGRLFYSAMVVPQPPSGIWGLQVAWSEDGGATWGGNIGLGPDAVALVPDRQWLGFGPDGLIVLSYNQVATGIWVARSEDGGATWRPFVLAAPIALRGGASGQAGAPVVDAGGRTYLPTITNDGLMRVFWSDDGLLWNTADAFGELGGAGAWFPMLALGPDGALHLASWYGGLLDAVVTSVNDHARLLMATSDDRGISWARPVAWGASVAAAPWIRADEHGVSVAWYRGGGNDIELVFARGDAMGPSREVVVQRGLQEGSRGANTDFASMDRLPDGRAVVAWALPGARTSVQVETLTP